MYNCQETPASRNDPRNKDIVQKYNGTTQIATYEEFRNIETTRDRRTDYIATN